MDWNVEGSYFTTDTNRYGEENARSKMTRWTIYVKCSIYFWITTTCYLNDVIYYWREKLKIWWLTQNLSLKYESYRTHIITFHMYLSIHDIKTYFLSKNWQFSNILFLNRKKKKFICLLSIMELKFVNNFFSSFL